ncbi:hypothetical protein PAXINDRAFT_180164 [Paxillus involutus ATCC 200175]|nr:hypothetical protein PAXINDRAFT_180164 [Paxillus involutus ATCC 200175]
MDRQAPPRKSGVRAALEHTGIPASWLSARPRLPSRNWCIFISITSSLISYYAYDRYQARAIRQSYIGRVKHLGEEPMGSLERPRKVAVYGAKWPGDEDHLRAVRFFKKYVKPVLVAAAIDYDIIATRHSGDLAERIASDVIKERRVALGIDPPAMFPIALPNQLTPEQQRVRELEGGVILVGRHTLKEYMAGLKRGWRGGLDKVDREDALAQELASDGKFDELPAPPTPSLSHPPTASSSPSIDSSPSATLPPHPPLLLVPCINYVGFRYIPLMIWGFFNERHKTRIGCEAAYSLIVNTTRDFQGPDSTLENDDGFSPDVQPAEGQETNEKESKVAQGQPQGGDLDFFISSESVLASHSPLSNIASSRKSYYNALPERLATARQLARGEREPTKEEENNPPPSEVELRAERLNKESRWRGEEEGWRIVRPGSGVSWDEKFRGVLRVFEDRLEDERVQDKDRDARREDGEA